MTKLQRWIDLLAALLRRRFPVTLEELRQEVPYYWRYRDVAPLRRTFERDKDELRAFGIPIETVTNPEGQVGYRLQARNFYLPYLTLRSGTRDGFSKPKKIDQYGYQSLPTLAFEQEELSAVADAAARVRQLGDPLLTEQAESALRKLAVDLPVDAATPQPEVIPPRAKASSDLLAALANALERHKRVVFTYHGMGDGKETRRTLEPFGLFYLNQHWYLAARTPGDLTIKNYRVNRIDQLEVNDKKPMFYDYDIPKSFDLRQHARSRPAWELGSGDAIDAVVQFRSASGASAAALRLGEEIPGHPRNRRFRVRRIDAFARWLLSFGGDLVPLSPRDLVDEYRGLVRETQEHHSTYPSTRLPASPR